LSFNVTVSSYAQVRSLDSAWTEDAYRQVLDLLDFGDTSALPPGELREMTLMALQDKEPHEAAEVLLLQRLGKRLSPGQRKEVSHEMVIDEMWEEHADMALHEQLFHIAGLLDAAMPDSFPEPRAASFVVQLEAVGDDEVADLAAVSEALICRAVAAGLPSNNVLHRLFGDQLAGRTFAEAADIVWSFTAEPKASGVAVISGLTSVRWFEGLAEGQTFAAEAWNDDPVAAPGE